MIGIKNNKILLFIIFFLFIFPPYAVHGQGQGAVNIYTSVLLNEINEIDTEKNICKLDFCLCFRFEKTSKIKPEKIKFLNEASLINIQKKAEKTVNNHQTLLIYHVTGSFMMDAFPGRYLFDRHIIGLNFRHKSLSKNHLVYLVDDQSSKKLSNTDYDFLKPSSMWKVRKISYFEKTLNANSRGNPKFLNTSKEKVQYSTFNYAIHIEKNKFSLRGIIPYENSFLIMTCTICLILGLYLVKKGLRIIWFFQLYCSIAFLLSTEVVLVNFFHNRINPFHMKLLIRTFDILWWLVPAFLINLAIKRFLLMPIEARSDGKIPNIIPRFIGFLVYLLAIFGIIAFVFQQEISKLLATGGMFAMIIGLAVKMNIADIISGIAINLESPFRIGDWIKIGDYEGTVVDITWRSTRLKTGENCILSIPNSKATESFIYNYNYPGDVNWLTINIRVSHIYEPEYVRKIILDAVMSTRDIMKKPKPKTSFNGLNDIAAEYNVKFCIRDYENKNIRLESVWNRIWIHLRYAKINMVLQGKEIPHEPVTKNIMLQENGLFSNFTKEELKELSDKMKKVHFNSGGVIIKQDTYGESFFFIYEGSVKVVVNLENGKPIEVDRMGVGEIFGEKSIIGEKRTADIIALNKTILYEITKTDMEPFLENKQGFYEKLKEIQTDRAINRETKKTKHNAESSQIRVNGGFYTRLLKFFGMKIKQRPLKI